MRVGAFLIDFALILPFLILQSIFNRNGTSILGFLMSLIVLGISAYNRWYLGGLGQSFGKKTLGLTLIGERTGQPIGTLMAFLRELAHIVDSMICFVGYLFPLWDSKRQTIADKIVSTVVISKA